MNIHFGLQFVGFGAVVDPFFEHGHFIWVQSCLPVIPEEGPGRGPNWLCHFDHGKRDTSKIGSTSVTTN